MPVLLACLIGLLVLFASPAGAAVIDDDPFAGGDLAAAAAVPSEFVEETAFDDLVAPASVSFSPDGRVFVAQLDGVIKVFDGLDDTTATVYADLSAKVAWHDDRGLLGMALDPQFTTGRPYIYVTYTYDAAIGGTAPRWNDNCPDPPGAERDGCVVSGRLSKILPDGSETPLITNEWCQQYPSHSLGDVKFGPDGALYMTGGDGASYTFADYGQDGAPVNPCGDPPGSAGSALTPPTAEGGALRSQDARTTGDPTGLNGAMLRLNPDTGAPLPTNPGTGDVNARRIVAYGFRNPFRFAFRPGTTDAYVGDVGWLAWEELNRIPDTTSQVRNYGWPCYEGTGRQGGYEALGLNICNNLYTAGTTVPPLYTYNHNNKVAGESCPVGSSAVSGVTFYEGGSFPQAYQGAMFFADYARNCIWVMFPNADGTPNPSTRQVFVDGARTPVDLEMGPGGDLYYADVGGGTIRRIRATNPNKSPNASFTATPSSGRAPLGVAFDATGSSDPNGDTLQYAWDLDGDGAYDDSTSATPSRTYTVEGNVTVRLRVSDPAGLVDSDERELTVGIPPTPVIAAPATNSTYRVGDTVSFSGSATREDGSRVPASQLQWTIDNHHCSALVPTNCHVHHIQDFNGVESGSFVYPDHEYPSHITIGLTATTSAGLRGQASVRIDPKTVDLTFRSVPAGLNVAVGGEASATPFTRTVAQGSTVGVAAPPSQFFAGSSYDFASWSDGGAAAHQFTAPATAATYTATYTETVCPTLPGLVGAWGFDEASGPVAFDASGRANSGTIAGPTRAAGRFGGALSFDGVNDLVTVADSNSLDLVSGMTLEGWVNPSALGAVWRTVLLKEQPGNLAYGLYANDDSGRTSGHVAVPFDTKVNGPGLPLNSWSHVATTYDGSTLRMYLNGTQVASQPLSGSVTVSSGSLRIGGNTVWAEWFAGLIDELRVYDRALAPIELQADMTRAITCSSDPGAPALAVSPASLSFTGTQGGASPAAKTLDVANTGGGTVNWTVADDAPWLDVTPGSGTNAGTITVSPSISGLTAGTRTATVTVTAAGAAGSPKSIPVTLTVDPPPQPPALAAAPSTLSFTATQGAATVDTKAINVTNSGGGTLSFSAAADVSWLNVSPASDTAPRTVSVTPSTAGLAPGTYTGNVTISAAGVAGSPKTVAVTFDVTAPPVCATPPGLVGAWAFDETSGTTTVDRSPAGNPGTVNGATRTAGGRFGGALSFDGINDWVTVADANSLDLSSGMTLSAWVNPAAAGSSWRTVLMKERSGGLSYALYGNTDTGQPSGHVSTPFESSTKGTSGLAAGVWSHLATTYDGTTLRLFVNGVQVSSRGVIGAIPADTGPLRIGGNAVWAEWFAGLVDEVRVYNRAQPAAELQADMANPVTCSGTTPPAALSVAPGSLSFAGTQGGASPAAKTFDVANTGGGQMAWTASESAPWLSVSPGSGTNAGTVTVTPAIAGLAAGTYTTDITVSAPGAGGSPKTVAVTFTVNPAATPSLAVAPSSLSFTGTAGGASPAAKTLDVSNAGTGTLSWTASESAPWLSVSPGSGTGAGAITVTPSISGLSPGSYTTDITVSAAGAGGSPKTIPVTFTVAAAPALAVAPANLSFTATQGGANPAAQDVTVSNTGGGTLSFTVADDAPWLTVTPAAGNAPATLSVAPSVAGLAQGTHTATATVSAAGASGSPKTVGVTLTVTAPPATPPGLVAAYGFEETTGTSATDGSGNGRTGTISGATRSASGRIGRALSFDGVNDWVTVADANALDLTTGMTMSAWVNPVAVGSIWRTVLMKEQPGDLIYALYAGDGTGKPSGNIFTTSEFGTSGAANTPLNTWTHLASTWDGTTLRLYVGGIQVSSRALAGTLRTSTGVLRIGGNGVWAEWFRGLIDEARVYNRALTATEIQADMTRPVVSPGP